ncbi:MBL fold metallo-hydrolase [Herbiconiux sp. P17]|uniref:MBL fold metallo-hydrolase n=1 Tax=Herbiconiux wuyangfengii TaxID=3342794 RepID=UPI0035B6B789
MTSTLSLEVFHSAPRAVPAAARPFTPPGGLTWPTTTSTLVIGQDAVVLVDAPNTIEDAIAVADRIDQLGKTLQTVIVSHAHADHFLGAPVLLARYPGARLVALPEIAEAMRAAVRPESIAYWNVIFGGENVPQEQAVADYVVDEVVELEDTQLHVRRVEQSDTEPASFVYITELGAVIGGDTAYNRVHVNLAGLGRRARLAWIESLEQIERLEPRIVVAGHKNAERADDPGIVRETIAYISDFHRLAVEGPEPQVLIRSMQESYPDWQNVTTLWNSAYSLVL